MILLYGEITSRPLRVGYKIKSLRPLYTTTTKEVQQRILLETRDADRGHTLGVHVIMPQQFPTAKGAYS